MKTTDDFREAITCCCQINKDEWDTKEDTCKSTKNSLYCTYCGMPKDTSRVEAMLNSEKVKPIDLAVFELHLSEGISQSVGWSVNKKKFSLIIKKS